MVGRVEGGEGVGSGRGEERPEVFERIGVVERTDRGRYTIQSEQRNLFCLGRQRLDGRMFVER